ncbi:MAG: FAD-dependent oxidoreductase [Candidatus Brocadiia bacterium]
MSSNNVLPHKTHECDFCVIGGGMAGLCAALAAARHGSQTILMHDRPVLGGNASSETKVHICGADRHGGIPNMRETGILEEIRLENLHRNPHRNYSIWDTVLYEKALQEPNLHVLYNCSCQEAEMSGQRIQSVTGWQLTTETRHTVHSQIYADCSGDGILAPLTGACWRMGREARHEFDESIAPEEADNCTMGMTCMFCAREYDEPQPFDPPEWAYTFENCDELPYGEDGHKKWECGYWWVELGGQSHSIYDTEELREELLKISYGVWDHIKNHCSVSANNWALDWLNFLPAKRESRRYIGDHVLNQNDVEAGGSFEDIVAYGGWTMDDHHPTGFWSAKSGEPATIFHPAPSPYGIPYRSLYSKNIDNLMFAGRCASCTHAAMSSTRVMGTGSVMGQAVGTAAAMAAERNLIPREMSDHIVELQQNLIDEDCYLPGIDDQLSEPTLSADLSSSAGNPEMIRDGINRPIEDKEHALIASAGDKVTLEWNETVRIRSLRMVVDSAMERLICMCPGDDDRLKFTPDEMPKNLRLEGRKDSQWIDLAEIEENHQRLINIPIEENLDGVRLTLVDTWGRDRSRIHKIEALRGKNG